MDILFIALPSIISAIVLAVLGVVAKTVSKTATQIEASNRASKYLLKDRITHACRHWQSEGYLPANEAELIQEMAQQYWALGGNSYVKQQLKITLSLPMEKPEKGE